MTTLYVVMGETGEYSDRQDWVVCAYSARELAEQHVLLASAWAREVFSRWQRNGGDWEERQALVKTNPYDPDMAMDYTGTNYTLQEVELRDSLPVAPPTVVGWDGGS